MINFLSPKKHHRFAWLHPWRNTMNRFTYRFTKIVSRSLRSITKRTSAFMWPKPILPIFPKRSSQKSPYMTKTFNGIARCQRIVDNILRRRHSMSVFPINIMRIFISYLGVRKMVSTNRHRWSIWDKIYRIFSCIPFPGGDIQWSIPVETNKWDEKYLALPQYGDVKVTTYRENKTVKISLEHIDFVRWRSSFSELI